MGILAQADGVNFADVEAKSGGFKARPKGWYPVIIDTAEEGETSENSAKYPNEPMLSVDLLINEGDYDEGHFFNNFIIHADFLGYLKAFLIACGYSKEEVDDKDFDFDAEDLEGIELDVKVNKKKARGGYGDDDGYQNNCVEFRPRGQAPQPYVTKEDSKAAAPKASAGFQV
jgi:hypothetical protein